MGRAVSPENGKTDEHGGIVHEKCDTEIMKLYIAVRSPRESRCATAVLGQTGEHHAERKHAVRFEARGRTVALRLGCHVCCRVRLYGNKFGPVAG